MVKPVMLMVGMLVFLCACKKDEDDEKPAPPDASPVELAEKVLVENLQLPWELVWGTDDHLWVTEKSGNISRVEPSSGTVIPVITLDEVETRGEGGLLGMALHPDFDASPEVFVAYNYSKGSNYVEKVVRFTYNGSTLVNPHILLDDIAAGNIHNGCRLVISPDRKLFITTGDASNQALPQNFSSNNGKVLRINLDGSIPADNPDPSSPVWSIGHRNAQGLVFINDSLFASEHGPDTDDEVNMIHKGGNYGWPDVRGVCDAAEQSFCTANKIEEPLMQWTPTIAVCGIDYYDSDTIPQWKNSVLMATLKASRLIQLKLDDSGKAITSESVFYSGTYGRLRDVCVSPNGKVYMCTSNGSNDKIIEISRK